MEKKFRGMALSLAAASALALSPLAPSAFAAEDGGEVRASEAVVTGEAPLLNADAAPG